MWKLLHNNTTGICIVIFSILTAIRAFETIVLRTDETILAENFIHKLFGIVVIVVVLKLFGWKWGNVGLTTDGIAKGATTGFALAVISFAVAYSVEMIILGSHGKCVSLEVFVLGFSLTESLIAQSGIGFILVCVFFYVLNVIMEEGTFRGLFFQILRTDHSARMANIVQALLFGIWHIVSPIRNWLDGNLTASGFLWLCIGYIIFAGIMGIKWEFMYRMTGSLYAGMADHFFNNCIATNLLHVTTENSIDEMMIVRVLIAQIFSFITVSFVWKRRKSSGVHVE